MRKKGKSLKWWKREMMEVREEGEGRKCGGRENAESDEGGIMLNVREEG